MFTLSFFLKFRHEKQEDENHFRRNLFAEILRRFQLETSNIATLLNVQATLDTSECLLA